MKVSSLSVLSCTSYVQDTFIFVLFAGAFLGFPLIPPAVLVPVGSVDGSCLDMGFIIYIQLI